MPAHTLSRATRAKITLRQTTEALRAINTRVQSPTTASHTRTRRRIPRLTRRSTPNLTTNPTSLSETPRAAPVSRSKTSRHTHPNAKTITHHAAITTLRSPTRRTHTTRMQPSPT
ncbi:MAG: hypothetical protein U0640_12555 [Phycisphaerales bacterium]